MEQQTATEFVVAVDVGTTCMRACIFDGACEVQKTVEKPVNLLYGDASYVVEMDPAETWNSFLGLLRLCVDWLKDRTFGIALCTQRNTFISWDADDLKPCHNLVTWKDGRGSSFCTQWNRSASVKCLNYAAKLGSLLTGSERFKAAGSFRFLNAMVSHKFLTTLETNPHMQELLAAGRLRMGCLDTWLLSQLSKGRAHVTEPSCASSTGLYDPFQRQWGDAILRLINFPRQVLPALVESAGRPLALVHADHLGREVPVLSSLGDSQAAVFGCGLAGAELAAERVKVSLGTGTFLDVLTARPHSTLSGVYPLIACAVGAEVVYATEARSNDTSTSINWARSLGLFEEEAELNAFLPGEQDPALHFVPAFSGIQTPADDPRAVCAFIGLKPTTTRRQMLRAVLDAVVFRVKHVWDTLLVELGEARRPTRTFRVCGGVSRNPLVCQGIADLVRTTVERVAQPELASARGAALLAGVTQGSWTLSDFSKLVRVEAVFTERAEQHEAIRAQYDEWLRAVERCLDFNR